MHQKWFLLTINHSVTLFLWTINGQLSPHTFPNLLIENECRLKACRLSAVATSKNEGRFNMQLDFIKINWPGEIQKNPAVPFFLCVCSGTYSSVYIHLSISISEVEDSQKILPPLHFITIT